MPTERKENHPNWFNWFLESKQALDGTTNTSPFKQKGWGWKGGEVQEGKEEVTGGHGVSRWEQVRLLLTSLFLGALCSEDPSSGALCWLDFPVLLSIKLIKKTVPGRT